MYPAVLRFFFLGVSSVCPSAEGRCVMVWFLRMIPTGRYYYLLLFGVFFFVSSAACGNLLLHEKRWLLQKFSQVGPETRCMGVPYEC